MKGDKQVGKWTGNKERSRRKEDSIILCFMYGRATDVRCPISGEPN